MINPILELADELSSTENPLVSAVTKLRDIHYGDIGSRDPVRVLLERRGTCSGKHFLLKEVLNELGYEVKDMIAEHKFNNLPVKLNDELQELLSRKEVPDPHNFLSVKVNESWINVDITWDKDLSKVGLETNENWDGKSDMEICVIPIKIISVEDGLRYKKEFISALPDDVKTFRREFITKFGEYLDTVRG